MLTGNGFSFTLVFKRLSNTPFPTCAQNTDFPYLPFVLRADTPGLSRNKIPCALTLVYTHVLLSYSSHTLKHKKALLLSLRNEMLRPLLDTHHSSPFSSSKYRVISERTFSSGLQCQNRSRLTLSNLFWLEQCVVV